MCTMLCTGAITEMSLNIRKNKILRSDILRDTTSIAFIVEFLNLKSKPCLFYFTFPFESVKIIENIHNKHIYNQLTSKNRNFGYIR